MSDPLILALIVAIGPTLASVAALIVALKTKTKVEEVHVATNSMKDALVAAARSNGHIQGVKDERAMSAVASAAHAQGVMDERASKPG